MNPYGRRGLDNDMMQNFQGQNGFGILANIWSCFMDTLEQGPGVVRLLVETGVILHNLLMTRFPAIANADVDREDEDHNIIAGAWRGDQQVEEISQSQAPNRDNRVGNVMRDYL